MADLPDRQRLHEDPLFLACTRPAMIWGVPMEAVGLNAVASCVAFVASGSMLWLLLAPALHLVFRAICRSDANAFRVLFLWIETKGRARNSGIWGGSSPTPLRLRRARAWREIARA